MTEHTHFSRAPDDIMNSDKIHSLLKDIREARQAKSREGLAKIDHSELSVCLALTVSSYYARIYYITNLLMIHILGF